MMLFLLVLSVLASWQERRSYVCGMGLTLLVFMLVPSVLASLIRLKALWLRGVVLRYVIQIVILLIFE